MTAQVTDDGRSYRIFLIAGEPSGDALGAGLMRALQARLGPLVTFAGIGGPQMRAAGLSSLFPYEDLAIMGLAEVLPRLVGIYLRIRKTVAALRGAPPDALITIDAQDFNLAVVKRLRRRDFPRLHYVAPTVWAWRPKRVHSYRRHFDHMLSVYPNEPPLFEAAGLACTFVGHPVLDGGAGHGDGAAFRARYEIPQNRLLVCLLPGSRAAEVARLMPVFGRAAAILQAEFEATRFVIPAMPAVEARIREESRKWSVPVRIVPAQEDRHDAMAASDVALAASGTVGLELAAARVPTVIAYKVAPLTAWIVRRLALVEHVNMVNILLGRGAVPELLQGDATPEALEAALEKLMTSEAHRRTVLQAQDEAIAMLRAPGGGDASDRAAEVVIETMTRWRPDP